MNPCQRPCDKKVGVETSLIQLGLDGSLAPTRELDLGKRPPLVVTPAQGTRFALVTSDGQWVSITAEPRRPRLEVRKRPVTLLPYLVPVSGMGRPTALTFDEKGHWLRLDDESERVLEASSMQDLVGILDAKLLVRWGEDTQIHLAWSAWRNQLTSYAHATLDHDTFRVLEHSALSARGVAPPFAQEVFAHRLGEGAFERSLWPFGRIGEPVDLRTEDRDAASTLIEWTGDRYVAFYIGGKEGKLELRSIAVDCSGAPPTAARVGP